MAIHLSQLIVLSKRKITSIVSVPSYPARAAWRVDEDHPAGDLWCASYHRDALGGMKEGMDYNSCAWLK